MALKNREVAYLVEEETYEKVVCGETRKTYTVEYDFLEAERNKLHYLVDKHGFNNPRVLRQSRIVDNIILIKMKNRT